MQYELVEEDYGYKNDILKKKYEQYVGKKKLYK